MGELRLGSPPLSVSAGLASIGTGARRAVDLLRAADAAQYTAKRTGRSRVYVAESDPRAAWRERRETRRVTIPDAGFRRVEDALDAALADALRVLDSDLAAASPVDRFGEVASRCGEALDASAWAISVARSDATMIETLHAVDTRAARAGGVRFDADKQLYVLSDYPMTADLLATGGRFVVSAAICLPTPRSGICSRVGGCRLCPPPPLAMVTETAGWSSSTRTVTPARSPTARATCARW
jgi:hypothetical protein